MGDPRHNGDGPAVLHYQGVDFPKGEWVDPIPDALCGKLTGNSHFEIEGDEPQEAPVSAVEPAPVPVAIQEPEPAPAPALEAVVEHPAQLRPDPDAIAPEPLVLPPDHDKDGVAGGSTASPEKDAVIAELKALNVDFDGRWGLPRLKAALEVAQFERGED